MSASIVKLFIATFIQLMMLSIHCYAGDKTVANVPGTPANVYGKADKNNTIALRWIAGDSGGATFDIWRDDGSWKKIGKSISNSYLDTTIGLERDRTYKYKVQACNASGCSKFSDVVAVKTFPAPPTNVRASITLYRSVQIEWQKVPINGCSFNLFRNSQLLTHTSYSPFVDMTANLTPPYRYTYCLEACNEAGCSDCSVASTVQKP